MKNRRCLLWTGLIGLVGCVHLLLLDAVPFLRMVVICTTLLIGMKWIVLYEWGGQLIWRRKFIFCFLWFGMEPRPFAVKKRILGWRKDALVGMSCFSIGLFASVTIAHFDGLPLLLMFVPLSITFHYGLLRLLTAWWRMRGIAVRPLFRNPLVCEGLADFWSKRWNLSFSQMMARTVHRPVANRFGRRVGTFSVFLVSGLLHELAITLPVQSGYGMPTLYFAAHGLVVLVERDSWPLWIKRSLAIAMVALPLPLLFPAQFTEEVIVFTLNQIIIF